MCAGFDGAPVVSGGDDHRVHAVHDAFIMGCGPVGICGGKGIGGDDPIPDFGSLEVAKCELLQRDGAPGPRDSSVGQIGQDP